MLNIFFHLISRVNSTRCVRLTKSWMYISKKSIPFPFTRCTLRCCWCLRLRTHHSNCICKCIKTPTNEHVSTIFCAPISTPRTIFRPTLEQIIFLFYSRSAFSHKFSFNANHPIDQPPESEHHFNCPLCPRTSEINSQKRWNFSFRCVLDSHSKNV